MLQPVGLQAFAEAHPERTFDVGIAEQHAVTSAAGLALAGLHPVVCLYATFLNRAFDQALMDVALHRLPVTFVLDRAGVTGEDGASHNGMWDLSLLSLVPGMRIAAPRDAATLREELREAVAGRRRPDGGALPQGRGRRRRARASSGAARSTCCAASPATRCCSSRSAPLARLGLEVAERCAAQGIGVTVVDPRWVVPVRPSSSRWRARTTWSSPSRTAAARAAWGLQVIAGAARRRRRRAGRDVGIPRRFLDHGTIAQVKAETGLTAQEVARRVVESVARLEPAIDGTPAQS